MLVWKAMRLAVFLLWGCSQNYSDQRVDQALAERGLTPLALRRPAAGAVAGRQSLGGLEARVPQGWQPIVPQNPMRQAEYLLPGEGEEHASLAIFHFGPGQGGGVEANIARWYAQFGQPEGARRWTRVVHGMPVTLVDAAGTYQAAQMGMGEEAEWREGYRMLGAVVESPAGSFFFKLVGPEPTVTRWEGDFNRYIESLRPE